MLESKLDSTRYKHNTAKKYKLDRVPTARKEYDTTEEIGATGQAFISSVAYAYF